jgi:hypothetical protein
VNFIFRLPVLRLVTLKAAKKAPPQKQTVFGTMQRFSRAQLREIFIHVTPENGRRWRNRIIAVSLVGKRETGDVDLIA